MDPSKRRKVVVVMPVYNAAKTLRMTYCRDGVPFKTSFRRDGILSVAAQFGRTG